LKENAVEEKENQDHLPKETKELEPIMVGFVRK
jgi:hypothetical protein